MSLKRVLHSIQQDSTFTQVRLRRLWRQCRNRWLIHARGGNKLSLRWNNPLLNTGLNPISLSLSQQRQCVHLAETWALNHPERPYMLNILLHCVFSLRQSNLWRVKVQPNNRGRLHHCVAKAQGSNAFFCLCMLQGHNITKTWNMRLLCWIQGWCAGDFDILSQISLK